MTRFLIAIAIFFSVCDAQAQIPGSAPFAGNLTAGDCIKASNAFQATDAGAPCGVGTVSSGTANQLGYYASSGSALSGLATANNGALVTSSVGVPSISLTLPSAVQGNITGTGTLVSGATGSGFTVALGASTVSGVLPATNGGAGSITGALKANGSGTVSQAACADLSNGATGCSTVVGTAATANTGTSGGTVPLLNGANTWSGVQTISSGDLSLKGSSSGAITLSAAAAAGTNTIVLPGGSTDFSATGGASQVVKQTSTGAAFTVGQIAASDLSNGTTGSGGVVLATSPTLVTPNLGIGTAVALILDDGSHNNYTLGRDGTTGYLFFNGKQSLYSGYEFQVNNGTTVLTINNAGLATFADGIASSSLATFAGGIAASDGSPGSPTSCGSGSPSVSGTNTRGTITLGTTPSACTLPWSTTLASAPVCVVSGGAATTIPSVTSTSTSNMVIGGTLVTGGKVNYICMQ